MAKEKKLPNLLCVMQTRVRGKVIKRGQVISKADNFDVRKGDSVWRFLTTMDRAKRFVETDIEVGEYKLDKNNEVVETGSKSDDKTKGKSDDKTKEPTKVPGAT